MRRDPRGSAPGAATTPVGVAVDQLARASRWCARAARPGARGRSRRAPPGGRSGSASATWRANPAGTSRSLSPQTNSAGGSSAASRVQKPLLAVGRVEVDVARGGVEGDPRRRASGRCGRTPRRRCRRRRGRAARGGRTCSRRARGRWSARSGCGIAASSGRSSRTSGTSRALRRKASAGASRLEARDPLGLAQADLERDPAAHRVADQVGAVDRQRVHEARDAIGEPGGVVGARARASRRSRSRAGRSRGPCARASARRPSRRTRPCCAPSPCRQIDLLGARRRRSGSRSGAPPMPTSAIAQQRRAAVRAGGRGPRSRARGRGRRGLEAPLGEGVEAREPALAQRQPGRGVGADHDVGLAAVGRGAPRSARRATRTSQVRPTSPSRTWIGRVEARLGARGSARAASRRPPRPARRRCSVSAAPGPRMPLWRRLPSAARTVPAATCAGPRSSASAQIRAQIAPRIAIDRVREVTDPATRSAASCARSSRGEPPRSASTPAGRPSTRAIHIGNARPFVVFTLLRAVPRARGLRADARDQRHRHQRQDLRRRARGGRALGRARRGDDRGLLRGHRPPRARPPRRRAAGDRDDRARSSR